MRPSISRACSKAVRMDGSTPSRGCIRSNHRPRNPVMPHSSSQRDQNALISGRPSAPSAIEGVMVTVSEESTWTTLEPSGARAWIPASADRGINEVDERIVFIVQTSKFDFRTTRIASPVTSEEAAARHVFGNRCGEGVVHHGAGDPVRPGRIRPGCPRRRRSLAPVRPDSPIHPG